MQVIQNRRVRAAPEYPLADLQSCVRSLCGKSRQRTFDSGDENALILVRLLVQADYGRAGTQFVQALGKGFSFSGGKAVADKRQRTIHAGGMLQGFFQRPR